MLTSRCYATPVVEILHLRLYSRDMLNRTHRFHGHNALKAVYQHGQTVRGSVISLKFASNNRQTYRVAVVVSKKVHKSAVVRNRIRRRVYEICRQQTVIKLSNQDLIFTIFSDQVATMDYEKLEKNIHDLLKKVA